MKMRRIILITLLLMTAYCNGQDSTNVQLIQNLADKGKIDSVLQSNDNSREHILLLFDIYEFTTGQLRQNTSEQIEIQNAIEKYQNSNPNVILNPKGFFDFHLSIFLVISILLTLIVYLFLNKSKKKLLNEKGKLEKNLIKTKSQLSDFNDKLHRDVAAKTKSLSEELERREKTDIDLKKALKKAEDANYVKSAFLSNMSHEIRTPLNGIIGFSDLLLTELSLMENKELFDYANGIRESGDRLLGLLNNIIDISRMEVNDMEVTLTPCEVNDILEKSSELFKFKANEKGIQFNVKYNEVPKVLGDQQSINRILTYIIDNAVKYTEKGFINILTDFEIETKNVCISIKDTGVGIDQTYLNHLFEAFRQESLGYSKNDHGAGLGLPLTKRLLDLMQGEIIVESKKGIGTTVKIKLKADSKSLEPEPIVKKEDELSQEEKSEKINIFIVEDDRMNRLVLNKMLAKVGNNKLAVDGEECLEIISKAYDEGLIFDIMLFDINLPAPWDGMLLMKEIKEKWPEYNSVPFIAQTAYAMTGDKERLLEAGFDDYIPKPVNKNGLISSIYRQLEIAKKEKI